LAAKALSRLQKVVHSPSPFKVASAKFAQNREKSILTTQKPHLRQVALVGKLVYRKNI
jgi:hypothetical protein